MEHLELVRVEVRTVPRPRLSDTLTCPAEVAAYVGGLEVHRQDREHFVVLHLDAGFAVVQHETVSIGCVNASIVHPREVFKAAVMANAAGLLLVHNHPSGDDTPSSEDVELTRRMVEASGIMGIHILDHLIVTQGPDGHCRFRSFKEEGLI